MIKNIIVTGATGLIGTRLCNRLKDRGDKITVFSRNADKAQKIVKGAERYVEWDYHKPKSWSKYLNDCDTVVHLAGANVFGKRWNESYKKTILRSRTESTQNIVKAIESAGNKPSALICSSAVGYYGESGERELTEDSPSGKDFLAEVCVEWETAAAEAEKLNVRRVSIRTGIVLSPDDGALKQMLLPFKLFVGGPLGNGKQWFPWIHIDDLIDAYIFAIDNDNLNGPVNAAANNAVRMRELAQKLGEVLHRPSFFKVPHFALKLAIGETADVVLESQKVIPKKLLDNKFVFKFNDVETALKNLLR